MKKREYYDRKDKKMNEILELLNRGETDKSVYRGVISEFSGILDMFLKEKEYDRSKKQIVNVYKIPSEKRLQQANLQLKNSDDDPSRLVPYGVKRCSDNLYKFFHEYNFGHISEFALNDKGWIDTTIRCLIYHYCCKSKKESDKAQFEKQLERLNEVGFSLFQKKDKIKIPASEKNITIIKELISKVCGKRIQVMIREEPDGIFIDKVSFMVRPEWLLQYVPETKEIEECKNKDSKTLTIDEITYMKALIKEIYSAIDAMNDMPSLVQTCGSLIESQVFSLCQILNLETEISKRYLEDIKEERKINGEIKRVEEELKEIAQNAEIGSIFKSTIESIDQWAREYLSFYVNNAQIDRYGNTTIKFSYLLEDFLYDNSLSHEELKREYKWFDFDENDEELYLVGCDNNKCKIEEKILERFPESEVTEWVYSSRGKMALMSFKVLFSTMPKI
jgi:hypothetical protein